MLRRLCLTLVVVALAVLAAGASARSTPGPPHCTAASMALGRGKALSPLAPGHPSAILICRYGPLPQHALLGSRLVIRRSRLRKIVHGLNALPAMPRVPISCPADIGDRLVLYLMYPKAVTRVVNIELTGCMTATRGTLVRWDAPGHGRFFRWLAGLTR